MGATRLYPDNIDKNRTRDSDFIAWFIANGDYSVAIGQYLRISPKTIKQRLHRNTVDNNRNGDDD